MINDNASACFATVANINISFAGLILARCSLMAMADADADADADTNVTIFDLNTYSVLRHVFFAFLQYPRFESNSKHTLSYKLLEGAGNCKPTLNEALVFLKKAHPHTPVFTAGIVER
jgi:hypothetical protein